MLDRLSTNLIGCCREQRVEIMTLKSGDRVTDGEVVDRGLLAGKAATS